MTPIVSTEVMNVSFFPGWPIQVCLCVAGIHFFADRGSLLVIIFIREHC